VRLRRIDDLAADINALHEVRDILWQHNGKAAVWLELVPGAGVARDWPIRRGVEVNPALLEDLAACSVAPRCAWPDEEAEEAA